MKSDGVSKELNQIYAGFLRKIYSLISTNFTYVGKSTSVQFQVQDVIARIPHSAECLSLP